MEGPRPPKHTCGSATKPPSPGMYKTNFDGAIFEDSGEIGIGVVIQNSRGEVMTSLAKKILNPTSVEMVEL